MSTRREILTAGLLLPGLLGPLGAAGRRRLRPPLPRVNGGINVQPLRRMDTVSDFTPPLIVPELVHLQMRAVYELGFRRMRITVSFNEFGPDFFAAIPYVRIARAIGVDVLAIVDQFGHGFDLLRALANPRRRGRVLQAYHDVFARPVQRASRRVARCGSIAFQILNEPTESRGLDPTDYVVRFLAPARADLASIDRGIPVVSAATVGRKAGIWRLREMLAAGLERSCDRVAVHVYDRSLIPELGRLVRAPSSVTETGVPGSSAHLAWVRDVYPELGDALPDLDEIYWFDLFDFTPGGFRLIDVFGAGPDRFGAAIESHDLCAWLAAKVSGAAGTVPHATFDELVPGVERYFPDGQDFAIAEAAR